MVEKMLFESAAPPRGKRGVHATPTTLIVTDYLSFNKTKEGYMKQPTLPELTNEEIDLLLNNREDN